MTDLATLGLAVDSSQIKSATDDLRIFQSVAARTGETVEEVQGRFGKLNSSAKSASSVTQDNTKSQSQYSDATNKVIQRLALQEQRLNSTARQWVINQNITRAGVDANSEVGQKIALATGALYDMEEAQKRAAAANDNSSSSVDRLTQRFTRAFVGGVILQGIKEIGSYLFNLNTQLAAVGDTATRLNISSGVFQRLEAVTGGKGISSADLSSSAQSLAANLNEGVKYSNTLSQLFAANSLSLKDNSGKAKDLVTILANVADLIRNARNEQDKFLILQEAGIQPTSQWIRVLEQGGVSFKLALDQARLSGVETSDELIRKAQQFDDKWNEATTNFSKRFRANSADALDFFDTLIVKVQKFAQEADSKITPLLMKWANINPLVGGFLLPLVGANQIATVGGQSAQAKSTASYSPQQRINDGFALVQAENDRVASAAKTKLYQDKVKENQIDAQRLGLMGPLLTSDEARHQAELQIQAAALNGIFIDEKRAEVLKRLAVEQNLGITYIKSSADALNVEAATIGMTTGQAVAYSAAQTILNEKKRLSVKVSDEQRDAILREAEAMGRAKDSVENLRFAHDSFQSTFVDFGQQIRNGASAFDALKTAGSNALGKIADKLMSMAADNLWKNAFGGASSSGGGLLGSLGSLLGIGGAPSIGTTSATAGASSFMMGGQSYQMFAAANGGTFGPGWGVVGERGPELINVHSAGVTVFPNHISRPYLPGFADGGILGASGNVSRLPVGKQDNSPIPVMLNINVSGARGNQEISDMVEQGVASGIKAFVASSQFPQVVVSAQYRGGQKALKR